MNNTLKNWQIFLLSVIISAVMLFVYSKNSLIYEMNDYIDVNVFFAVTESMFHGNVLYTDIFEHKGPFLYLVVYALAHLFGNSYFTIYLFECAANALFVYFGTKIILQFDEEATNAKIFLYAICLEFCLCTSAVFMFGGTVEELYLWMSLYGLYVTLRCLKHEEYYFNKDLVIIGLLCGALFWTKFSLLGCYAGLALFVIIWNLKQKKYSRLGITTALFLAGFAISCTPILIYSLMTHNFNDMFNVYFIGNIFGNHQTSNYTAHFYTLMNIIYKDVASALLITFGIMLSLKQNQKDINLMIIMTFIPAFLASCCLRVLFAYYPMPMLVFIPFGIVSLQKIKVQGKLKLILVVLVLMIHLFASVEFGMYDPVIGSHINPNWLKEHVRVLIKALIPLSLLYLAISNKRRIFEGSSKEFVLCVGILIVCAAAGLGIRDPFYFTKQALPQTRFKETIMHIENANILVYGGYDYGFYKSSKTYPQVKYFCNLNLSEAGTDSVQLDYIKSETVDFIITQNRNIENLLSGTSYQLVDFSEPYYYNGYVTTFYLYKKSKYDNIASIKEGLNNIVFRCADDCKCFEFQRFTRI